MIGLFLVTLVVLTAIIGPFAAPYDPNDHSAMLRGAANAAPNARNWLGTDRNGYDVLSRAIYGAPTALAVGLGAMLIASLIGVLVGGVAGYVGGFTDEALMRGAEFFMVVPVFVVILAVVRLFGIIVVGTPLERIPNLNLMTIILLLGLFSWPPDRADDARRVPAAAPCRIRRGGTLHRHHTARDPVPPHPAQRAAAADRAGGAGDRRRHPGRGDGELPGLRRSQSRSPGGRCCSSTIRP